MSGEALGAVRWEVGPVAVHEHGFSTELRDDGRTRNVAVPWTAVQALRRTETMTVKQRGRYQTKYFHQVLVIDHLEDGVPRSFQLTIGAERGQPALDFVALLAERTWPSRAARIAADLAAGGHRFSPLVQVTGNALVLGTERTATITLPSITSVTPDRRRPRITEQAWVVRARDPRSGVRSTVVTPTWAAMADFDVLRSILVSQSAAPEAAEPAASVARRRFQNGMGGYAGVAIVAALFGGLTLLGPRPQWWLLAVAAGFAVLAVAAHLLAKAQRPYR